MTDDGARICAAIRRVQARVDARRAGPPTHPTDEEPRPCLTRCTSVYPPPRSIRRWPRSSTVASSRTPRRNGSCAPSMPPGRYPDRALRYCLETAGVSLDEVASVTVGFDLAAYTDGRMRRFFDGMAQEWPLRPGHPELAARRPELDEHSRADGKHHLHWRRQFGDIAFPPIRFAPHHYTHAFQSAMESPFESAVVLTLDGSGDEHTTVLWLKRGAELTRAARGAHAALPRLVLRRVHRVPRVRRLRRRVQGDGAGRARKARPGPGGARRQGAAAGVRRRRVPARPVLHPLRGALLLAAVHRQARQAARRPRRGCPATRSTSGTSTWPSRCSRRWRTRPAG